VEEDGFSVGKEVLR